MRYRRPVGSLVAGLVAGGSAAALGTLAVAGVSAAMGLRAAAPFAALVGIVCGAGCAAAVYALACERRRARMGLRVAGAAMAATAAFGGVGLHNLPVMAVGLTTSCRLGLGRCLATGVGAMPVMSRVGPVQRHPVVRLVAWGVRGQQLQAAERSERAAPSLGQPLLRTAYGVDPARDGGVVQVPGDPAPWLVEHHVRALTPTVLAGLVHRVESATGWPDTGQTQWWVISDLSARQMGIRESGSCADHVRAPGVRGVIVRLPVRSCRPPPRRSRPAAGKRCSPVSIIRPQVAEPTSQSANLQITIGHEYAEAATDPANGWRLLVTPNCGGYLSVEIADVCSPDGWIISAPAYETAAGWQPSLLQPPQGGRPARCVDPARPDRSESPAPSRPPGKG